jgi:isopenicillin N synthase-like dioxygenase
LSAADIPVIDIGALRAGHSGAERDVASQMLTAAQGLGFFYVAGHGVSRAILDEAQAQALAFFQQPLEKKLEVEVNAAHHGFLRVGEATMHGARLPDLKESFIWGLELDPGDAAAAADNPFLGDNSWPPERPGLRRALTAFFGAVNAVGVDLLRAFAVSMDLEPDAFVRDFRRPISRGSAIYYPPQPEPQDPARFGVSAHTDFGCLTLLYQDSVGGLEVLDRQGNWVDAVPIDRTFVVNVGDLLARWTNDRFVSTSHRVRNRSGRERLSLGVFVDPDFETTIDPAVVCRGGDTPKYSPVRCGDYILERYAGAFAYRQ